MKIGVMGTGMVGRTIASKLVALGHEVMMGSRTATNEKAAAWVAEAGDGANAGTYAQAAAFGAWIFNCTSGVASLEALTMAGAEHMAGKILVDVANPLDFSQGFPPRLTVCNDDSLGEQLQRAFPQARVVKTLNTVHCELMVNPGKLGKPHDMFVCGDDAEARAEVTAFLRDELGWASVVDLGGLSAARGTEAYLLLWVRLYQAAGTADFNVGLVRG